MSPDICGGIIRDVKGVISSPNFPFFYPKNQTCVWRIIAPAHHTLKLTFLDINLPGLRRCKITDHVKIDDVFRNWNDTSVQSKWGSQDGTDSRFHFISLFSLSSDTEIGTYCGMTIPDPIETATNEAVITFQSDNFEYAVYKGFSMSFSAGKESTNVRLIYRSRGNTNAKL